MSAIKSTVQGEHIFPASRIVPIALRWKELHTAGDAEGAMHLLNDIIIGSTEMYQALAQHERYHLTVDIDILLAAAREKTVKWLMYWDPDKGPLFSWLSTCAKNCFRAEIVKAVQWRRKVHTTDDNVTLDRLCGSNDHDVDRHDAAAEFLGKLHELTCRWGSKQEIGTIHYLLECVIDDNHNKVAAIRGASYAWGTSIEMSRFFYGWVVISLRDIMYNKAHIPFTEQDLLRHNESYSYIPDLLNIIPFSALKQIIAVFGGTRLKIPRIADVIKWKEDYELHQELQQSDLDPATVSRIAKKRKRSDKSAAEIFGQMQETLNPNRSGEYSVYGNPD